MKISSYNKVNLLVTMVLVVITFALQATILPRLQNWLYIALAFFLLLNIVLGLVAHKAGLNDRQATTHSMLTTIIRLFSCLFFILIYLLVSDVKDIVSIIFFLFYYFLYMGFEIYHLVHKLRVQK